MCVFRLGHKNVSKNEFGKMGNTHIADAVNEIFNIPLFSNLSYFLEKRHDFFKSGVKGQHRLYFQALNCLFLIMAFRGAWSLFWSNVHHFLFFFFFKCMLTMLQYGISNMIVSRFVISEIQSNIKKSSCHVFVYTILILKLKF